MYACADDCFMINFVTNIIAVLIIIVKNVQFIEAADSWTCDATGKIDRNSVQFNVNVSYLILITVYRNRLYFIIIIRM